MSPKRKLKKELRKHSVRTEYAFNLKPKDKILLGRKICTVKSVDNQSVPFGKLHQTISCISLEENGNLPLMWNETVKVLSKKKPLKKRVFARISDWLKRKAQ